MLVAVAVRAWMALVAVLLVVAKAVKTQNPQPVEMLQQTLVQAVAALLTIPQVLVVQEELVYPSQQLIIPVLQLAAQL
jgi:hypothetical protein